MPEILDWLESLPRFSKLSYNLYRMWLLLNRCVPRYKDLEVFNITGSKGKGTVAVTLAAILARAGIPVGLLTSPHLINVTERISFNGKDIGESVLLFYLEKIRASLPPLPKQYGNWIYPEILMAAGLSWFIEMGARTVVVEAGMGGRLDQGNIFRRPLATCITTVTMEHVGILGNTLVEIAREKAGIIKPHTPLVTGADGVALAVIRRRAERMDSPLLLYAQEYGWLEDNGYRLKLPGRILEFQGEFKTEADKLNIAMAACLSDFHPLVSPRAIIEGVKLASLPGRFEIHQGKPILVLDVAHTPEAVDNLLRAVSRRFPDCRVAWVAGFLADKSVLAMLKRMTAMSAAVFYAPVEDRRSFDVDLLDTPGAVKAESISKAIDLASGQADVICVTGSFSAVREARKLLSKRM